MKSMQKFAFLCLVICPLISFAAQANNSDVPNYSNVSSTQKAQEEQNNQDLIINSNALGLKGPFSLSTIYSKTFGLILEGKYTQLLGGANALALELDGGKAERRIGVTWGHVLTPNQRIKLTAEDLSQKMDFDFDSGNVSKWVYQNAIGGTYQYLLTNKLIKDINLNAYYSKANSSDLGYKDFEQNGTLWRNYRRIAGATDKSASAGLDISPLESTLIGLQLNYDQVKYNTHYNATNSNSSGMGATVSLHQLVNQRMQFSLLASSRKPYKDYQAEVDWLLSSVPGSKLQLGLVGERIDANFGLPNDNRVGLQLTYSWGGNDSDKPVFSNPMPSNDANGLKEWVASPAVHMEQVLAIKDQKTVAAPSSGSVAAMNANADFYFNNKWGNPINKTEEVGAEITDIDYGHDQSSLDNLLFINNAFNTYPVDSFKIKYHGFSSEQQPQGLSIKTTQWSGDFGPYNYEAQVVGKLTKEDFQNSQYPNEVHFDIVAVSHGISATASFVIKSKHVYPTIKFTQPDVYVVTAGKTADVALATVSTNDDETVDQGKFTLDKDLSADHNLVLDISDCKGKTSCIVRLKSADGKPVTNPIFDKAEHIKLTYVKADQTDGSGCFDLGVIDKPKLTNEDLGKGSYKVGEKIDSITDLSGHFKNPQQSGSMHFVLTDTQGDTAEMIDQKYGLSASGDQLVADKEISADATSTTMEVYAVNNVGQSDQCAEYKLTVFTENPTMSFKHSDYVVTVGEAAHEELATVTTGDDSTVDQGAFKLDQDLVTKHSLELDTSDCIGKTSCTVYLKSSSVTGATFGKAENINVTFTRADHQDVSGAFNLSVAGVPEVKSGGQELGVGSYNRGEKILSRPIAGLSNHFDVPVASGVITGYVLKDSLGTADVEKTYGLAVQNGMLISTHNVAADAPIANNIEIHIYAKNDKGVSVGYITYHLSLSKTVIDVVKPSVQYKVGYKTSGDGDLIARVYTDRPLDEVVILGEKVFLAQLGLQKNIVAVGDNEYDVYLQSSGGVKRPTENAKFDIKVQVSSGDVTQGYFYITVTQ